MTDRTDDRGLLKVRAAMYSGALMAGMFLILVGHTSPVEASGYVTPFLTIFEGVSRKA
jgi:hypothetical protein